MKSSSFLNPEDKQIYKNELVKLMKSSFNLPLVFNQWEDVDFLKKLIIEEMNPQIQDIGIGLYDYCGSLKYDSRKILLPQKNSGVIKITFITPYMDVILDMEEIELDIHESNESGDIELIETVYISMKKLIVEPLKVLNVKVDTTWKFWRVHTELEWSLIN